MGAVEARETERDSVTVPVIIECEQGSDEWFQARLGLPTASEFKKVLAKSKELRMRTGYMRKLAGEILTGKPAEHYTNAHMERGHIQEPEALDLYCFVNEIEPQRVGFIRNGDTGVSPDALLGWDGAVEVKSVLPHIAVEIICADKFPTEFEAQVQGGLWIMERDWCDLVVYCPDMPLFVKRAERNEDFIKLIAKEVALFNADLHALVDKVRDYQTPVTIKKQFEQSVLVA